MREPRLLNVREVARYTATPIPLVDGAMVTDPAREAVSHAARAEFHTLLDATMLPEDEGRVTVFVHGFNVNFERAVITAAELAELLGRRELVIAYSWPAGSGTLLRGYTHDQESGEFSVLHLRRTLREIAAAPRVRQLNLMAHSRGTDVLTSALREINLEERAAGRSTRETLKLGHVVLATPDLDLEVVSQRIAAERRPLPATRGGSSDRQRARSSAEADSRRCLATEPRIPEARRLRDGGPRRDDAVIGSDRPGGDRHVALTPLRQ